MAIFVFDRWFGKAFFSSLLVKFLAGQDTGAAVRRLAGSAQYCGSHLGGCWCFWTCRDSYRRIAVFRTRQVKKSRCNRDFPAR